MPQTSTGSLREEELLLDQTPQKEEKKAVLFWKRVKRQQDRQTKRLLEQGEQGKNMEESEQ